MLKNIESYFVKLTAICSSSISRQKDTKGKDLKKKYLDIEMYLSSIFNPMVFIKRFVAFQIILCMPLACFPHTKHKKGKGLCI